MLSYSLKFSLYLYVLPVVYEKATYLPLCITCTVIYTFDGL